MLKHKICQKLYFALAGKLKLVFNIRGSPGPFQTFAGPFQAFLIDFYPKWIQEYIPNLIFFYVGILYISQKFR